MLIVKKLMPASLSAMSCPGGLGLQMTRRQPQAALVAARNAQALPAGGI